MMKKMQKRLNQEMKFRIQTENSLKVEKSRSKDLSLENEELRTKCQSLMDQLAEKMLTPTQSQVKQPILEEMAQNYFEKEEYAEQVQHAEEETVEDEELMHKL